MKFRSPTHQQTSSDSPSLSSYLYSLPPLTFNLVTMLLPITLVLGWIIYLTFPYITASPPATTKEKFLKYAEMAQYVYLPKQKIFDQYQNQYDDVFVSRRLPKSHTRFFVLSDHHNKSQVVVLRGPNELELLTAAQIAHTPLGQFPRGLWESAELVENSISLNLKRDYQITFVGHSVGGGIVTLVALILDQKKYQIEQLITFGQPKVMVEQSPLTPVSFPIFRVINNRDPLPYLPLHPGFVHLGPEWILLSKQYYTYVPSHCKEKALAGSLVAQVTPEEGGVKGNENLLDLYLSRLQQPGEFVPYSARYSFGIDLLERGTQGLLLAFLALVLSFVWVYLLEIKYFPRPLFFTVLAIVAIITLWFGDKNLILASFLGAIVAFFWPWLVTQVNQYQQQDATPLHRVADLLIAAIVGAGAGMIIGVANWQGSKALASLLIGSILSVILVCFCLFIWQAFRETRLE